MSDEQAAGGGGASGPDRSPPATDHAWCARPEVHRVLAAQDVGGLYVLLG